jgi:hypothetical protein
MFESGHYAGVQVMHLAESGIFQFLHHSVKCVKSDQT